MKTTPVLPDELVRRVKVLAAQRNQKLEDTVAQLLEIGLANAPDAEPPAKPPRPVRLKGTPPLRIGDIESAIAHRR